MNDTQLTLTRIALGTAAVVATLSAPITVACATIGGIASYKLGANYGQKKYGARDVGGAVPIVLICLGSGLGGVIASSYVGASLSAHFFDSAEAHTVRTSENSAHNVQEKQVLQNSFSRHFVHSFAAK
jgi:hypothetical protein